MAKPLVGVGKCISAISAALRAKAAATPPSIHE
jgi:hypothetical protein